MKQDMNDTFRIALRAMVVAAMTLLASSTVTAQNTPTGPRVHGNVYGGGNLATVGGSVTVNMSAGTVEKDVYGGGALANTNINNASNYGTENETVPSTSTNTTTVNLTGGTIMGDAYGGGLGRIEVSAVTGEKYTQEEIDAAQEGDPAYGKTTAEWKVEPIEAVEGVEATVYGDINVNLGSSTSSSSATAFYLSNYEGDYSSVAKSGRIFGCNNLNGSPRGNVTVTVYSTVRSKDSEGNDIARTVITRNDKDEITDVATPHQYDVAAVYGGGNLAGYTTTGKKASVRIWTCEASVHSVYGGGNAAAVPETDVLVRGAYEIEEVFGGGNGKDSYTIDGGTTWETNPGANVNGNATTLLTGGFIHEAYGGSNSKGTISGNVSIDKSSGGDCTLRVDDLYGAGKDADIEGDLIMVLGCSQTRTENIYGCSKNANVKGNVELTITSGEYGRVFGGNNESGSIFGHIIVNIEEVGCSPIIIDELYGCGNDAAYSVYGYYHAKKYAKTESGEEKLFLDAGMTIPLYKDDSNNLYKDEGKTIPLYKNENDFLFIDQEKTRCLYMPRTSANDPNGIVVFSEHPHTVLDETKTHYDDPEVNIISCTRIGRVFGGGLGEHATVYGNPQVNINMMKGAWAGKTYGTVAIPDQLGKVGDGYTDADANPVEGGVFGGGNEASVEGNTTVNIGNLIGEQVNLAILDNAGNPIKNDDGNYTFTPATVTGANITGSVYGGGNLANVGRSHLEKDENDKDKDVIDVVGNTFVNICVKGEEIVDDQGQPTGGYNYTSVTEGDEGVTIAGNVFGGGKGEAAEPIGTDALPGAFRCGKAMVTGSTNVRIGNGTVGNGTVGGNVYGGGEVGRVEVNTVVTIGCENENNSAPVINGNVFGAGAGTNSHGYSALVRGNSYVTVQGEAKVKKSVYGGGEIASVGKYIINAQGMPESLANQGSGYCTVVVRDKSVIGPDEVMIMTRNGGPDDSGHVFGAGKGVLPYEGYEPNEKAWRVTPGNTKQEYLSLNEAKGGTGESDYLTYVETLGLATQTYVTVDENAFVKGSVYGGSENGYVQHHTQVNIQGNCQIGNGYVQMNDNGEYLTTKVGVNRRYTTKEWEAGHLFVDGDTEVDGSSASEAALKTAVSTNYATSLPECASWTYGQATDAADRYAPHDKFEGEAGYETVGGRSTADDGHTYYGNVFGGGSGVVPYRPGKWHPEAGSVGGNTVVNITGGHILTNVYGGNEMTDVYGKCTVNFGGTATLGVPRTLKQIDAHPVTCYLFGAGKGDQRVLFNKSTNVEEVEVNITGGRIYGSVFGGGEDGHVHRNVTMNISDDTSESNHTNTMIGTWGTSYVDGNVFGGGRGFGGDAYTAGNIAGSVTMNIHGGTMLGSIYGGGRLGSVGYGLFNEGVDGYGEMRPDNTVEESNPTSATDFNRGHIDITISGGTIGNDYEYIVPNSSNIPNTITQTDISKWTSENWATWKAHNHIPKTEFDASGRLTHTKGGNVFAGGMGRQTQLDGQTPISAINWWQLGCVKQTKLTITGGHIKSNVYGGGELGAVIPYTNGSTTEGGTTEIDISDSADIGTPVTESVTTGEGESAQTNDVPRYTFGSVFGGGMGSENDTSTEEKIGGRVAGSTKITMTDGDVKGSVYGGGELAIVQGSHTAKNSKDEDMSVGTEINISGGKIGYNQDGFGGATMGNVYGGGKGSLATANAGLIKNNTLVKITGTPTIYHNIYGGGAYGSVGTFDFTTSIPDNWTNNTGKAEVIVESGTIGINGHENGMVFGSSRGDVAAPVAPSQGATPVDPNDRLAWVYDTHVVIGNSTSSGGPSIKGTVYGSGENGHTFNNTLVDVNKGTIGIETDAEITYTENGQSLTKGGAAYPYRGNVYGGGCGTDMYDSNGDGTDDTFNPLAGIVLGNATVNINGGTVVRNVYGAGAMGSVGKTVTTTANNVTTTTISGGTTKINVSDGTIGVDGTNGDGNVFGAARGNENATINEFALVKKETSVSVTGSTIKGNVYGGGELGCVGTFTVSQDMRTFTWQDTNGANNTTGNEKNTGICNVTVDGSSAVINGHVYGAGKGKDDTFWCEKGIAYSTNVNIKNGTVNHNVYGGGEVGRVENDTQVKIGNGIGTAGGTITPTIMGSVFGGGAGEETHGYSALVRGNTTVSVEGNAKVEQSVYGGGQIASVGRYALDSQKMPSILQGGGYCYVTVLGHATIGEDVFGAGKGVTPHFNNSDDNLSKRSRRMSLKDGWEQLVGDDRFDWDYLTSESDYSTYLETLALATHPEVTIDGNATVNGSVFGGGELGLTKGSVIVNIHGGTIAEDVYGGGSLANTNTTNSVDTNGDGVADQTVDPTTTVNLKGGTINRNVYGGGLGRLAKDAVAATPAQGTVGEDGYEPAVEAQPAVSPVEAKVCGEVLVKLNEPTTTTTGEGEGATTTTYGDCEVKGTIFGCNNLNGSPQKDVTVHVYKTVKKDNSSVIAKPTKDSGTYELTAVYGGGNLAAYYPDDPTTRGIATTNVIIDGCELTSIKQVYGGGNAASVPATHVVVNGTYEIEEVFGGGNGLDKISKNGTLITNPGANVGFKDYWDYTNEKDLADFDTKDKRLTNTTFLANYVYGSGKASVDIYGGLVHRVFGGSNTRGNVRETAVTMLQDMEGCEFVIDEAYGGGKSAPMDAEAKLLMACIPGLSVAYGGAQDADVQGGVTMTITNGTFDRVFGGNNISGTINGPIVVNIEETGCRPIVIGQLYGGGNQAAYTALDDGEGPTLNVHSFTSIGEIYGGGYGETAVVKGDTHVNIDVTEGKWASNETTEDVIKEIKFSEFKRTSDGGFEVDGNGNRIEETKTITVTIPGHKKDAIGAIGNVFGGGNAAKVDGNTNVNIGTKEDVYMAYPVESGTSLTGYFTRSGEGTESSPYIYSEANGTAVDGTTYYKNYTIMGADIRGNVYGGGNNAKVTGNTNVVIGKEAQ